MADRFKRLTGLIMHGSAPRRRNRAARCRLVYRVSRRCGETRIRWTASPVVTGDRDTPWIGHLSDDSPDDPAVDRRRRKPRLGQHRHVRIGVVVDGRVADRGMQKAVGDAASGVAESLGLTSPSGAARVGKPTPTPSAAPKPAPTASKPRARSNTRPVSLVALVGRQRAVAIEHV